MTERLIEKDVGESGRGRFQYTIPVFTSRDWRKSLNSSYRIRGRPADIRTRDLRYSNQ
jgi:hypothetical protein